jgi:hypothetical protein
MKPSTVLIAVAFAAVSGAVSAQTGLAGDISIETKPFVSTNSSAEVRDKLAAFKKSGVDPWARNYNPLAGFVSSKSRAEVTAEYLANRAAVAALNQEDSGSMYLSEVAATANRAVRIAGPNGDDVRH